MPSHICHPHVFLCTNLIVTVFDAAVVLIIAQQLFLSLVFGEFAVAVAVVVHSVHVHLARGAVRAGACVLAGSVAVQSRAPARQRL